MEGIESLEVSLTHWEAMALAQFVKRLTWSELEACSVDENEAYLMRAAIDKLQIALREYGYAPR
ncbi:hypothetical protein ACJVQT_23150 [Enterobacter huaxiensis]|uniref:DUF7706 family protein n=1 Tax=Enterobacter huaxiensis TaxID=2494702 RepID=UPI002175DF7F|nr:hypothetical protein [Enterobacter huaxiensis]MCS5452476.1 hypothetical protein [Enterobacter huaxiensis]